LAFAKDGRRSAPDNATKSDAPKASAEGRTEELPDLPLEEPMKPEAKEFLSLLLRPARVTMPEAAWLLGFQEHDIPILIARGLLRPLGHPAHNGQKFFLTATLEDLRRDEKWFVRASDAVVDYWKDKNNRKGQAQPPENRRASPSAAGKRGTETTAGRVTEVN
jgi:hypothetical protein